jgi:hypothetical protein
MSRRERKRLWISVGACMLLSACVTEPVSQKLTGDEIKALLTGRTYECEGRYGSYSAYYANADSVVVNYADYDGGSQRVKGALRYESDALCVTWSRTDWGKGCYAFYREGDAVRAVKQTNSARKDECLGKVVDGNPRRF